MLDIRSSTPIEIATHRDKTEDVEILETPEAPTENVALPISPVEVPASEVPPPVEVDAATIGHVSVKANPR